MSIRRVVADVGSLKMAESRDFYVGVLGFEVAMDMQWIVTLASKENPTAQINLLAQADASGGEKTPLPDISVEVGDVEAVHAKAAGARIVYPLTDEPWGVRRFFVEDPNGKIINVMMHAGQ